VRFQFDARVAFSYSNPISKYQTLLTIFRDASHFLLADVLLWFARENVLLWFWVFKKKKMLLNSF